ncbi:MAG: DUF4340 domain-containing protein [Cyanobacteria bacterium J06641_5]
MKLQKNTLALLFLAICLGVYTLATQDRASESGVSVEPVPEETPAEAIFSIAEAELAALTIEREDEIIRLVKNEPVAEPITDGDGSGVESDTAANGDGESVAEDAGDDGEGVTDTNEDDSGAGSVAVDGDNATDTNAGGDNSGDSVAEDAGSEDDRATNAGGDGDEGDAPATWSMETPEAGPVSSAAVAFLVDLLLVKPEAGLHSFEVERELLEEYGLAEPSATLSLELQDGDRRQLVLGNPSFEGQSLYARLDPERDGEIVTVEVILVNADLQSAIERPVKEWLQTDAP